MIITVYNWNNNPKFIDVPVESIDGIASIDIYVAKCKKSVWKEILKTIKEAKKYFVVEYRVVSTRDS